MLTAEKMARSWRAGNKTEGNSETIQKTLIFDYEKSLCKIIEQVKEDNPGITNGEIKDLAKQKFYQVYPDAKKFARAYSIFTKSGKNYDKDITTYDEQMGRRFVQLLRETYAKTGLVKLGASKKHTVKIESNRSKFTAVYESLAKNYTVLPPDKMIEELVEGISYSGVTSARHRLKVVGFGFEPYYIGKNTFWKVTERPPQKSVGETFFESLSDEQKELFAKLIGRDKNE